MKLGLVIGAMKSGTTTLYRDLEQSPEITLLPKEGGIFSRGGRLPELDGVVVEVCSDYTMADLFPDVPHHVRAEVGTDVDLFYLVRDPIERLESHLRHWSSLGRQVTADDLDETNHLVRTSLYGQQTKRWLDAGFGAPHFIDFHAYARHRADVLAGVTDLLQVSRIALRDEQAVSIANASKELRSARPGIRAVVRSSAYGRVKHLVPEGLRQRLKASALTAPADLEVGLDPAVRARLVELFARDLADCAGRVEAVPAWFRDYDGRVR